VLQDVEFVSETVNYVLLTGTAPATFAQPAPITMRLRSQRTAIRGVSVDAEFSPAPVTVYGGVAANGTGYVVQPGSARAFGVDKTSAIHVTFAPAPAGVGGYVRITAYAAPVIGYGIATGAAAVARIGGRVEQRLHHIVTLLEQILAKIP
jgi:hypothetical protein